MTNKKPLMLILPLGIGAIVTVAVQVLAPANPVGGTPAEIVWISLSVLVSLIPVRRLVGTHSVNLGLLIAFTTLALFGTGTAVVAAWGVGIATALSSCSGNRRADVERVLLNSGKYVVSVGLAGLVLWGIDTGKGVLDTGLDHMVMLKLVAAYAVHLGVKGLIGSAFMGLRDSKHPWDTRILTADWLKISAWIIPPAAYLLALIYLNSSVLTVTMLVSVLVVQGLTSAEERLSRASWIRLTDGLRQACDGHVVKHRGETDGAVSVATTIGRKMKLPARNLRLLGHAAALHNVGYIALDQEVVLRPGRLSPDDLEAIRQHPECSRDILGRVAGLEDVAEIVRYHHESPDGSGYPCGLDGDDIPIEAAIIKVAEAFTAMTSPRVYRGRTLSRDQAVEEIGASAGKAFDPIAAYYLCEALGRGDLASGIVQRYGMPDRSTIAKRLSKCGLTKHPQRGGSRASRRSIIAGTALLGGAMAATIALSRSAGSSALVQPLLWFTLDAAGAVFLLALLGLGLVKPVRLSWGANVSWASAIVLAMVLAGGPAYIAIAGMAMIGWTFILGWPGRVTSNADSGDRDQAGEESANESSTVDGTGPKAARIEIAPLRMHERVLARIDRSNRVRGNLAAIAYCMVIMLAAGSAWSACWLGRSFYADDLIGLILSPLIIGVISTGTFYFVETVLQAGLLSKGGPSLSRIWYRNYAGAFPEPLTYAIFGYGVFIVSGLLGIWTAVLLFALPTIWRHSVLVNRTGTVKTTCDLVRSIAQAVDLRNGVPTTHASSVATTALAVARQMGKRECFAEDLEKAAMLHDIGKASWPNRALTQRNHWNAKDERYKYIHPDMSAEIATWAGYTDTVTEMIRSHHEHYDGSGYTRGLKGIQIPLGGRILCAADSFTKMIQTGDPRFGRTLPEAVREMRFGSEKQFDPEVVKALMQVLESAVFTEPSVPEHLEAATAKADVGVGV